MTMVYAYFDSFERARSTADGLARASFELDSVYAFGASREGIAALPFGLGLRRGYATAVAGAITAALVSLWGAAGGGSTLQRQLDLQVLGWLPNLNAALALPWLGAAIGGLAGLLFAFVGQRRAEATLRGLDGPAVVALTPPDGLVDDAASRLSFRSSDGAHMQACYDEPRAFVVRALLAATRDAAPPAR